MNSLSEELIELIASEALVDRETLIPGAKLDSLGIDSVDFVSIMFAVEERYSVTIEDDEISKSATLADMLSLFEKKIAAVRGIDLHAA